MQRGGQYVRDGVQSIMNRWASLVAQISPFIPIALTLKDFWMLDVKPIKLKLLGNRNMRINWTTTQPNALTQKKIVTVILSWRCYRECKFVM
jgi:hypothetical protein